MLQPPTIKPDICIHPGVIDVLVDVGSEWSDREVLCTTDSYSLQHYDEQRPVFVRHKLHQQDEQLIHDPPDSNMIPTSEQAFESYIRDCKPVKISQVLSFIQQDTDFLQPITFNNKLDTDLKQDRRRYIDKVLQETHFPSHLLDKKIEVLCQYHSKQGPVRKKAKRNHGTENKLHIEQLHQYLSVLDPHQQLIHPTPVFLGHDSSHTMTLSFREIFYQSFDQADDALQIYVAQQNILSSRDSFPSTFITCLENGRLQYSKHAATHTNNCPLSELAPYIRAPSDLLSPTLAQILEVNLWYSSQSCCTNYHYDSNHNILMVLTGTKTIELSPPDTIRPAPLYANHANHPAILDFNYKVEHSLRIQEGEQTRLGLLEKSFVVSVSAGQGIFIPQGWWHRVESSQVCMAINVWFDHPKYSVASLISSVHSHMMTFHIREITRMYYTEQLTKVGQQFIEIDKQKWMRILRHDFHMEESFLSKMQHDPNDIVDSWDSLPNMSQKYLTALLNWFLLLLDPSEETHRRLAIALLNHIGQACTKYSFEWNLLIFSMEPSQCFIMSIIWEKHETKEVENSWNKLFLRCHEKLHECMRHIVCGCEDFKKRVMIDIHKSLSII